MQYFKFAIRLSLVGAPCPCIVGNTKGTRRDWEEVLLHVVISGRGGGVRNLIGSGADSLFQKLFVVSGNCAKYCVIAN